MCSSQEEHPEKRPIALLPQEGTPQVSLDTLRLELEMCREELRRLRSEGYGEVVPMSDVFVVLDDLERVLASAQRRVDYKTLLGGINLICRNLMGLIEAAGVKKMEVVGERFDPFRHNVLVEVDVASIGEAVVIEELRAGYASGEKIVRQPIVKIGVIAQKGKKVFENGNKGTQRA